MAATGDMPVSPPVEPAASTGENVEHLASEADAKPVQVDHEELQDPQQHFCVAVLNGHALLQCPVARPADQSQQTSATSGAVEDLAIIGEPQGLFLQIMFYSPNYPQKCDYAVHGTLELLNDQGQMEASIYLGVLEDGRTVEKKQRTVARHPRRFRLVVQRIPPLGPNPNEAQLIEEITAVLENPKLNPGRGSLPSVMVQHRAKESPLYEKVVGRRFGSSWHAFMKANQETFSLFHYSQKEIQERKLSPFCKFNEARVVLRKHEQGHDWRAADERAAQDHAAAEEGLKQHLISLLEKRDYDQRELLEVLNGNAFFNHFLSPTFSILMRTLNRHKGTFITSSDEDLPTRVGLARADRHQAQSGPMIAPRAQAPQVPVHLQHRAPIQGFGSAPAIGADLGGMYDMMDGDRRGGKGRRDGKGMKGSKGRPPTFGNVPAGYPSQPYRRPPGRDYDRRLGGAQYQQPMQQVVHVDQGRMIGGQQQLVVQGAPGGVPGLGGQQVVSQSMLEVTDPQLQQVLSQIPGLDQNTTVVVLQQPDGGAQPMPGQAPGQQQVQYLIQEQGNVGGGVHLGQGLYLPAGAQQIVVHQDGGVEGLPPPVSLPGQQVVVGGPPQF
eukprot:TRINITY_DN10861_c0_g6_i5.p1 TRINITY_DN10861_c0_g6~~TRINITY_DN10861_c0_g6_i5.p1  ORF type:complete len:663 (+),score=224.54 TRINITY_DN10861_c0_g6_i5:163-1989(+)